MRTAQIEWMHLDGADALGVGDIVSAAAGGLPIYRVVALAGPEAWVQDDDHAQVRRLPLSCLHWRAGVSGADR